ncbi:MAG TPA: hypothetical protein VMH86_13465 [Rhizomicrobium sp.]|nr:hypothetical protein [Rhizomicrobium sp.]
MNDDDHNNVVEMRRATAREWRAAQFVLAGGFVIALGVAGYFGWRAAHPPVTSEIAPAAPEATTQPTEQQQEDAKAAILVCAQELLNAKNYGIVPGYGQLSNPYPKPTSAKGRYSCEAKTTSTTYVMTADLICRTLTDPRCVDLYRVQTSDGSVLYQRQPQ